MKNFPFPIGLASAAALAACLNLAGCASAPTLDSRFEKISPEMTTNEVKGVMGQGPSRFENINTDYASWYWGDDHCVLFKSGKVASKDSTSAGRSASVGGGKYEENRRAQCLAPGQASAKGTDRTIHIPGFGTVHLPSNSTAQPSG